MPVFFNRSIVLCLLLSMSGSLHCAGQEPGTEERHITALLERIYTERRFVEELQENNLTNLPVGIKKTISNTTVVIAIDSARITPQGMIINAYTQLSIPPSNKVITFALRGAVITPTGLSQMGPTRLEVIGDFRIPVSGQVTMLIPANGMNFIDWDCTGFKSVNLNGEFEFSSEIFLPDNPGKNNRVTAGFNINTSDLKNILIETSITPFRIKGLGDMSFAVSKAVADMSDIVNCDGFAMPRDYRLLFPDAPQLWRGFFLKDLVIRLPSELSNGKPNEIKASDLLIDDFGISGRFSVSNILAFDQGSASGWPFSIKYLEAGLVRNKIVEGELKGELGVPFLGDEPLSYAAQVLSTNNGLQYYFAVKTTDGQEYPVPFGGTVRLDKGCIFNMKVVDGKFIPSAVLNGTMYLSDESAKIDGLRFERLQLMAESPYIKGGKFDTSGGAGFNIAGFGLSVDSISLAFRSGRASLGLNAKVALMNKSDKGISASTRMFINATAKNESGSPGNDRLKWSYDGILLEGVRIKGGVSLFNLNGNVFIYRNHPVYGDGFTGAVAFTAGKIIKDTVQAEIRFGNKTDFRYWYAHIDIPTDLPLGTVTLSNLGGGAYSNMERADLYSVTSEYLPKKDAGLGLLADVGMYVKSKKIFNADVELEIGINKTGGLKFIRFGGEGRFLAPEGAKTSITKMTASVNMLFDNDNNSFHANLRVYLNVANAIHGRGPDDLLGEAVIHSDPSDWYVYVGRPSSPLGVDVAGLLQAQTYFMAGTRIESMPLPPTEVASIIANKNLDFMKNERDMAEGRGIAFGVMFKASAGIGEKSGFVYAYFNAGAGADIMLQNYGEAKCEGRDGPIGINGWYASGQGYAYLTGKVGIRVKRSEFDIMSVAAALLVQAKMPNPSWFRGNIAARYSILGGLVKGKVNVTVVLGEECVLVSNGNELAGLNLIGDISPSDGSNEVDVFAAPQVSFNTIIDKEFGMVNLNDEYAVYQVKLSEFGLSSAGSKINGVIQWNPAHDMATFKMADILPGRQKIEAKVKVHIEKKTSAGWQPLETTPEIKTFVFSTGDEPKSVPAGNVAYSYPLMNQYNFHRSEYNEGYIKLNYGLPKLFAAETDDIKWDFVAKFKSGNMTSESHLNYNESEALLTFGIPQNLSDDAVYDMVILKRPVQSQTDANLKRTDVMVAAVNPSDTIKLAATEITHTDVSAAETNLYSLSFRTSLYPTFSAKMQSIQNWQDLSAVDDKEEKKSYMSILYIKGSLKESFDLYEIEGNNQTKPLVFLEASRGNSWIESHAWPLIYELYGAGNLTLTRNTELLGLLPLKAVFLMNSTTGNYLLNGQAIARPDQFFLKYSVPIYVGNDYYDLRSKAVRTYVNQPSIPLQAQRLLAGYLEDLPSGNYPFTIGYRLPGLNRVTYSSIYNFRY